jgi:hypothetical protein
MPTTGRHHHCSQAAVDFTPAQRDVSRVTRASRRRFGLVALSALALMVTPPGLLQAPTTAWAASSPCEGDPEQPTGRRPAPASVSAGLAAPFGYQAGALDQQAVLADVVQVVTKQASELELEGCYREKPGQIALRVDFLSPYEFLVVSLFDHDPARRDALLDQYVTDPQGAIKALGDAYPSTRAQAAMATYAYFDLASGHIRVNAAKVPPDEIRRVLVHEFWHAMPLARTWTAPDGRTLRASGFWLQEQRTGRRAWVPLVDRRGLPYASYLLDEAMATLMETRYAGPSRFARHDLDDVQQFLDRLIGVAGAETVLGTYLHSQPYEIGELAEAHRASFPELEIVAQP